MLDGFYKTNEVAERKKRKMAHETGCLWHMQHEAVTAKRSYDSRSFSLARGRRQRVRPRSSREIRCSSAVTINNGKIQINHTSLAMLSAGLVRHIINWVGGSIEAS